MLKFKRVIISRVISPENIVRIIDWILFFSGLDFSSLAAINTTKQHSTTRAFIEAFKGTDNELQDTTHVSNTHTEYLRETPCLCDI